MLPKIEGDLHRLDVIAIPPGGLVRVATDLAMVDTAERNGEFIADLAAKRPRLRKT
jgi:hypothetical protein